MGKTGGLRHPTAVDLLTGLGAVLVAFDAAGLGRADRRWAAAAAILTVMVLALTGRARDRALPRPGSLPALLGLCWVAAYGCVPETSDQMFHVAALLVVMGVTELALRSVLPWWSHSCATAVVMWAGLYGSAGRPSAVVGALFAMWPLVLPALTVLAVPGLATAHAAVRATVVALAAAASITVARTGALASDLAPAVRDTSLAASISAVTAVAIAATAAHRTGRASGATGNIAP